MDSIILRLGINQLKAQVKLCEIVCAGLEEKCSVEHLSPGEKDKLAKHWGAALIDGNKLRAHLERLEEV